jgi:mannose/fructose-specific phosphotransferase system component IIA
MMSNRVDEAVQRLKRLAESDDSEAGLSVPMMIEAVMGPAFDEELQSLVEMALKSNISGMTLDEIANGIVSLDEWRFSQA